MNRISRRIYLAFLIILSVAAFGCSGDVYESLIDSDTEALPLDLVSIISSNANDTSLAKVGDTVTITMTAKEKIKLPVVTISGNAATVTGAGKEFTATYTMQSADAEGIVPFTIDFSDVAGNKAKQEVLTKDSSSVTFDRTAPSGYYASFDYPAVNSTNQAAMRFSFSSAEVGASFVYSVDDTNIGTAPVTGSGTISAANAQVTGIDLTALDEDTLTLAVSLTDPAGNQGGDTLDTAEKDIQLPDVPDASDITLLGTSVAINATTDSTAVIAGTVEAYATVEIVIDGTPTGVYVTADGTGDFTLSNADLDLAGITGGDTGNQYTTPILVTLLVTDTAGNSVETALDIEYTRDTIPPDPPDNSDINPNLDTSPVINSTTADTATITGTVEPGARVEIVINFALTGVYVTADGSGNFTLTNANLDTAGITAGEDYSTGSEKVVQLDITDSSGNTTRTTGDISYTKDTLAPSQPNNNDISPNLNTTFYVNAANDGTVTLTGTVEADATVEILIDGLSVSPTPVTVTALGSGDFIFDHDDLVAAGLAGGSDYSTAKVVTLKITDTPGNSTTTTNDIDYIRDTVAPTLSALSIASEYAVNNDFVYDVYASGDEVFVTFTANESLSARSVTLNFGSGNKTAGYDSGSGSGPYIYKYQVLSGDSSGPIPFTVSITDTAGNPNSYDEGDVTDASFVIHDMATVQFSYIEGDHDGATGAVLSDSTASWTINQFANKYRVYNVTDGSSGLITANDATTVTAALSGGSGDNWESGDQYKIKQETGGEFVTSLTLQVKRSSEETYASSVTLSPGGTATLGADAVFSTGEDYTLNGVTSVVIPANQDTATVDIIINNDTLDENSETIILNISGPNASGDIQHTYTINDDDDPPNVSFQSATSYIRDETAGSAVNIPVSISIQSGLEITVPITVGGTGVEGTDYTLSGLSGSSGNYYLTYAAGTATLTQNITVTPVVNDGDIDNETVILSIGGTPTNVTPGAITTHTTTIYDDDGPLRLSIGDVSAYEESGTISIPVRLSGPLSSTGQIVILSYSTQNGTAEAPADYTSVSGTLGGVGTHTGANDTGILTDSTKTFVEDSLIGLRVYNLTDNSSGIITENDATTVTATLSGGIDNHWDNADSYRIPTWYIDGSPYPDRNITITIVNDSLAESDETIYLNIGASITPDLSNFQIVDGQGLVTILNNNAVDQSLTIVSAETLDILGNQADGFIDHYRITFNKSVNESTFDGYTAAGTLGAITGKWQVAGYTEVRLVPAALVPAIAGPDTADNSVIYLRFKQGTIVDTGKKPQLTAVASNVESAGDGAGRLYYNSGNVAQSDVIETDKAGPVIWYALAQHTGSAGDDEDSNNHAGKNDLLTIKYSESTDAPALVFADLAAQFNIPSGHTLGDTEDDIASITWASDIYENDTLQIKFATDNPTIDEGDYISAAQSDIFDLAGNLPPVTSTVPPFTVPAYAIAGTFDDPTNFGPRIVSAESMDTDTNGHIDHVKITFDRPVYESTFPGYKGDNRVNDVTADWMIAGYVNVALDTTDSLDSDPNDEIIWLKFSEGANYDTGVKPDITVDVSAGATAALQGKDPDATNPCYMYVTNTSYCADLPWVSSNITVGTADVAEEDAAAPILTLATARVGEKYVFTKFSENIWGLPDTPACGAGGELKKRDFGYTDTSGDGAGEIDSVASIDNCGESDGFVKLLADVVIEATDIGEDTINAAAEDIDTGAGIYDAANNVSPAGVSVSIELTNSPYVVAASTFTTGSGTGTQYWMRVVFSEPMDYTTATNAANYVLEYEDQGTCGETLASTPLSVRAVSTSVFDIQTSYQCNEAIYKVTVNNVMNIDNIEPVSEPNIATAKGTSGYYTGTDGTETDETKPRIMQALSLNPTQVLLTFSEPMKQANQTGTTECADSGFPYSCTANVDGTNKKYTITPTLGDIQKVEKTSDPSVYTLTHQNNQQGLYYTVTVYNQNTVTAIPEDLAGNDMDVVPYNKVTFGGDGTIIDEFDDGAMFDDPFADLTDFSFAFSYREKIYLGPNTENSSAYRFEPDGNNPITVSFLHETEGSHVSPTGSHTSATGSHNGTGSNTTLTDPSKAWVTNMFAGKTINNTTDGSSCVIGTNTATTITCQTTLSGGGDNTWQNNDVYTLTDTNNLATLLDSTKSWLTDMFVGRTITNITDGSSCAITANTTNTVTCVLSGGTDNDWDVGDNYIININNLSWLYDSTKTWRTNIHVGKTVYNLTDGSSCTIASNTVTTVTCSVALSGGDENDWDAGDSYKINSYSFGYEDGLGPNGEDGIVGFNSGIITIGSDQYDIFMVGPLDLDGVRYTYFSQDADIEINWTGGLFTATGGGNTRSVQSTYAFGNSYYAGLSSFHNQQAPILVRQQLTDIDSDGILELSTASDLSIRSVDYLGKQGSPANPAKAAYSDAVVGIDSMIYIPTGGSPTPGNTFYIANNGGMTYSTGAPGSFSDTPAVSQADLGGVTLVLPDSPVGLAKIRPGQKGVPVLLVYKDVMYMARNLAQGQTNATDQTTNNGAEIWKCSTNCTTNTSWSRVIQSTNMRYKVFETGSHNGSNNVAVLSDSTKAWVAGSFVNLYVYNVTDGSKAVITANTATTVTGTSIVGPTITGTHSGSNDEPILTDISKAWVPNVLVGYKVTNNTDGSTGTITSNSATTITATLTGGSENDWDSGDSYSIDNDWDAGDVYEVRNPGGSHTGTNASATLKDSTVTWIAGSMTTPAWYVYNLTQSTSGPITSVTATDITATGVTWNSGDLYEIRLPGTYNTAISVMQVNGDYLYIGFDNTIHGATLWKTGVSSITGASNFTQSSSAGMNKGVAYKYLFSSASQEKYGKDYIYVTIGDDFDSIKVIRQIDE